MKLSELLSRNAIVAELKSSTRDGVMAELVEALVTAGCLDQKSAEPVLKALADRETQGSTGFGKGVAVPHCQHAAVKRMVLAVGRATGGVDFNALDKAPVYSVFLLLSPPDDQDQHLQAMELIFRPLQRATFRKWLRQADTPKAIMDCIAQAQDVGED